MRGHPGLRGHSTEDLGVRIEKRRILNKVRTGIPTALSSRSKGWGVGRGSASEGWFGPGLSRVSKLKVNSGTGSPSSLSRRLRSGGRARVRRLGPVWSRVEVCVVSPLRATLSPRGEGSDQGLGWCGITSECTDKGNAGTGTPSKVCSCNKGWGVGRGSANLDWLVPCVS